MSRPGITAKFVLDENGDPKTPSSGYYLVRLGLVGVPRDTYAVTYELHPTFYDAVREVRNRPDFAEDIITYGDFVVQARIRSRNGSVTVARSLIEALKESHGSVNRTAVRTALRDIGEN